MNVKQFIDLVEEMRAAQTSFFATHDWNFYHKAKRLEKRVDEVIAAYRNNLQKRAGIQLSLFND